MTVAIVDDLNKDIETLEKNIEKYCQEHMIHLKVQQFTSEASFLLSLDNTEYSLVFLDIYMEK